MNERRCAQAEAELRVMGPTSPPAPSGHEGGVAGSEEGEAQGSDGESGESEGVAREGGWGSTHVMHGCSRLIIETLASRQ